MPSEPIAPALAEAMIAAFRRAYESQVPFREDGVASVDLASEILPVLEALLGASRNTEAGASCHEAYALLNLFGHRAGRLGITPSAAVAMLDAVVEALHTANAVVSAEFRAQLLMVVMEGYCAGRDERSSEGLKRIAVQSQVSFMLAPRCHVAFLAGSLEPDDLEAVLEELARTLLRGNVQSSVLDVSRLAGPWLEESVRALVGYCLSARTLGAEVILCGAAPELQLWLARFDLTAAGASSTESFEDALQDALARTGHVISQPLPRWMEALLALARGNLSARERAARQRA